MPLFANTNQESLSVILVIFFSLVTVWCYAAYRFTKIPALANNFTRYGSYFVPFVLMGLGVFILIDSHTLEDQGLTLLTAVIVGFCFLAEAREALQYCAASTEVHHNSIKK